jgi:HAMP domain-containing protein
LSSQDLNSVSKKVIPEPPTGKTSRLIKLGLRSKMIALFFVIPILFFTIAGFLYLRQIQELSGLLTVESTKIVQKMAEDKLADSSRAVADQCRLYLLSHPGLRKEEFNNNTIFKRLSIQKIGLTGYTALYERPDKAGIWRTWAHPQKKIIGIDMTLLKKPLKTNFNGFWKVYTGVAEGKESRGYYTWKERDGTFREKYMVCTPIEGTRFVVAATTYIDELTQPVEALKERSYALSQKTRNTIIAILSVTLFVTGLIVSIYGHRLTSRLKSLTDIADRISVGELEAEIPIKSNDEIGELSEAISRMQDSIRLSIERLRRRR